MTFEAVDAVVIWEAEVEEADRLVCRAGGEELVHGRVEGEGVDGIGVGILEDDGGLVVGRAADIHDLNRAVVGDGSKEVLAELGMPLHVVYCGAVVGELARGAERLAVQGEVTREVPEVHRLIFAAGQQLTLCVRIPLERETLAGVTFQHSLRLRGIVAWYRRVLGAIPDVHILVRRESSDYIWVLRLVTSLVHLARVYHLLHHRKLDLFFTRTVATKLFGSRVVV